MLVMKTLILKRLFFYWICSFTIAVTGYYFLWLIMPGHYVFGSWYRMFEYHSSNPVAYIIIPCIVYGMVATFFSDYFVQTQLMHRIFLTAVIIVLTIFLSSPFGGMLWNYHDMRAGYFPSNWVDTMVIRGFRMGGQMGWLIVGLSVPYNILGSIICYFLTKKGATCFVNDQH